MNYNQGYFPDPGLANEDGILAVGGTLDVPVLLEAYSKGIFPWYSEGSPILWWSPDPRMVLFPDRLKISKSLRQTIRNKDFEPRMDTAFGEVIEHCSIVPRVGQKGTWITRGMIDAYMVLHDAGYAHSVEVYQNGKLVGGLYGVSLGAAFFGESMFHLKRDASKVALYHLVEFVKEKGFLFLDAQQSTLHMKSLGAEDMPRIGFLELLKKAIEKDTLGYKWT